MSDYLGHLAQRAGTTTRQVMPRVGALFEPVFNGIHVLAAFARDEATEGNQEQAPPQLSVMDERLQELHSTLNAATTVQAEFEADPRTIEHQGSRPVPPARAVAQAAPGQSDSPARELPSQTRGPGLLVASHTPLVRGEAREPGTLQVAAETHASRESHPGSNRRSVGVRPAVAATGRPQAEQVARTVRIEIGRIEIRATASPTRTHTTRSAARPRQTLEEYLQQQSRPNR
jgi:hypothetical protein